MSQRDPTIEEATRYAEAYIKKNDQTAAFKAAFPKSKMKPDAMYVEASKFHSLPKVRLRIDQLSEAAKKKSEEDHGITVSKIIENLAHVAELAVKPKKIILDGVPVPDDESGGMGGDPVNLSAAVSAYNEINKVLGFHAAEKRIIGGDKENPLQVLVNEISGNTLKPGDGL